MIIDLCSGLGRWSEEAVSIDIDRKTRPTIQADIRYLPLRKGIKPKHLHASPPCKYFSIARVRHFGYDEKGLAESFRIVAACFDAIDWLEPETWTIENPQGVLKRILPSDVKTNYRAYDYPHKPTSFWSNNKSLKRAIIPQDVRASLLVRRVSK
jgi:site-specific DNA-cytosine methylase